MLYAGEVSINGSSAMEFTGTERRECSCEASHPSGSTISFPYVSRGDGSVMGSVRAEPHPIALASMDGEHGKPSRCVRTPLLARRCWMGRCMCGPGGERVQMYLCCPWDNIGKELDDEPTCPHAPYLQVEEDAGVVVRGVGCIRVLRERKQLRGRARCRGGHPILWRLR